MNEKLKKALAKNLDEIEKYLRKWGGNDDDDEIYDIKAYIRERDQIWEEYLHD